MRIRMPFFVLILVVAVQCRAQDKIELFGGYSYVRGVIEVRPNGPLVACPPNCSPPSPVTQHANLNGWNVSGTYKMAGLLGLTADLGGPPGPWKGGPPPLICFFSGRKCLFPDESLLSCTDCSEEPTNPSGHLAPRSFSLPAR